MRKFNYRVAVGLFALCCLSVLNFRYAYDGYGNALLAHVDAGTGKGTAKKGGTTKVSSSNHTGGLLSTLWGAITNVIQGQGLTKDEREEKIPCDEKKTTGPTSFSIHAGVPIKGLPVNFEVGGTSGGETKENSPSNKNYRITCPVGTENCSEVDC